MRLWAKCRAILEIQQTIERIKAKGTDLFGYIAAYFTYLFHCICFLKMYFQTKNRSKGDNLF